MVAPSARRTLKGTNGFASIRLRISSLLITPPEMQTPFLAACPGRGKSHFLPAAVPLRRKHQRAGAVQNLADLAEKRPLLIDRPLLTQYRRCLKSLPHRRRSGPGTCLPESSG